MPFPSRARTEGRTSSWRFADRALRRLRRRVDGAERLHQRTCHPGATRAERPPPRSLESRPARVTTCRRSLADGLCSARTTNGFEHAGRDAGGGQLAEADDPVVRSPCRRGSFAWASAGFSCTPGTSSRPTMAAPAAAIGSGRRIDDVAPSGPRNRSPRRSPRRSGAASRERLLIRWPSSDEQRGQERDCSDHRDRRDQHPADSDRADDRDRDDHHRQEPDRDRRAGDDHRSARMRMVSTTAVSTSSPCASSSRKRKIISRE